MSAPPPERLLIRVFECSGRIRIPGSDYGGPAQNVQAAVLTRSDTLGWIPCPVFWYFVRDPATGDLVVDLAGDAKMGMVILYAAPPKAIRQKKRARKKTARGQKEP